MSWWGFLVVINNLSTFMAEHNGMTFVLVNKNVQIRIQKSV
jgi:hypothetical protein